jgi:hypothetical protein
MKMTTSSYVLAGLGALTVAGVAYLLLRQQQQTQQQALVSPGVVTLGPGGTTAPPLPAATASGAQASG